VGGGSRRHAPRKVPSDACTPRGSGSLPGFGFQGHFPCAQFKIASGRTVRPLPAIRVRRRDARTNLAILVRPSDLENE